VSYSQAIVLGIIQGLTEFLPVSSSGHLALAQHWMRLEAESPLMISFDVATHLGTLLAVIVVFWTTFIRFFRRLVSEQRRAPTTPNLTRPSSWFVRNAAWRVLILGAIACLPTAIIGVAFKDPLEAAFGRPILIGIALLVTGALLFVSGKVPRPRKPWRQFGIVGALLVGLAQGLAITPGISRSGATICTALICGLKRRWAAEFSFLIAFPAICGAALVKIAETGNLPPEQIAAIPLGPIIAGSLTAAAVGYVALRLLLEAVRRAKLVYFSYYVWALGLLVIVLGMTGQLGR
jgi:undecaprenyl-diphosphatase